MVIARQKSLNSRRKSRLLPQISPGQKPQRTPLQAHQRKRNNQYVRTQSDVCVFRFFSCSRRTACPRVIRGSYRVGRSRPISSLLPDLPRNTCDVQHAKRKCRACATFQWRGCTRGCAGFVMPAIPCSRPRIIVPWRPTPLSTASRARRFASSAEVTSPQKVAYEYIASARRAISPTLATMDRHRAGARRTVRGSFRKRNLKHAKPICRLPSSLRRLPGLRGNARSHTRTRIDQ